MVFILEIICLIKGAYTINLDDYSDIGTHWVALYVNTKTVAYFDNLGVEHISKEIKNFINNKSMLFYCYLIECCLIV